jgi:GNAT superfamily N-acetyltransferase
LGNKLMTFRDALISTYCEEPCRVLPNAIWKTLQEVDKFEASFEVKDGIVMRLEMVNEECLHLYWHRDRYYPNIPEDHLTHLNFLIIHQDYLGAFPLKCFGMRKPYFRLIRRNRPVQPKKLPSGFRIVSVNIKTEAEAVAEIIRNCYKDFNPSGQSVQSWASYPVFDQDSWIWVIDERKGIPVGLGIAEVDREISEASLDWIQVLPEYRGRGLGESIVLELLDRLYDRVEFTTVSGEIENQTNPEGLYRRCGFRGDDIWWLLRR